MLMNAIKNNNNLFTNSTKKVIIYYYQLKIIKTDIKEKKIFAHLRLQSTVIMGLLS